MRTTKKQKVVKSYNICPQRAYLQTPSTEFHLSPPLIIPIPIFLIDMPITLQQIWRKIAVKKKKSQTLTESLLNLASSFSTVEFFFPIIYTLQVSVLINFTDKTVFFPKFLSFVFCLFILIVIF